jgi:NTP pyrophosphatase (non-canonical NTP hydrolase)
MQNDENQIKEALSILQEECAEVVQAVSKIFRFGYDDEYDGATNRQRLEEEIGDLLAMVDILVENSVISDGNLNEARKNKKIKLKTWSSISL